MNVNGRRHLVLVTAEQLVHLGWAKTWCIDGTFKLVRHPFTQLLTINAFVRKTTIQSRCRWCSRSFFLGTRFGTSDGLQRRPRNVRVHQKGRGPAVPSSRGDSRYVCTASGDGIDSETSAVNAVCRQELDHRQHVAAVLLERVQKSVRTNNDIEDWYLRLNHRASGTRSARKLPKACSYLNGPVAS